MSASVATRLPGIQFEVAAPPVTEALPRMDIAVFVGFAASGPINEPVVVENITDFHEIFGEDLVLARSAAGLQPLYAMLPSSVRAFFRNGGRRCWIVRVAGESVASTLFPIPGLSMLDKGTPVQAFARARSVGSWADGLVVAASIESHPIVVNYFDRNLAVIGLVVISTDEVSVGDLLRLTFGGHGRLWFVVDSVASQGFSPRFSPGSGQTLTVRGTIVFEEASISPPSGGLPVCERLTMDLSVRDDDQDSWLLTGLGFVPQHPRYWANLPDDSEVFTSATLDGGWPDAANPRFPLAGVNRDALFLPLGLDAVPVYSDPVVQALDALERDGLTDFNSALFIDPKLADPLVRDLSAEADFIRYQSSAPRKLTGMHAALSIDEATLIAVPDATQRGWTRIDPAPLASPPDSSPLQHPEWWHFLDCNKHQDVPRVPAPPLGQFIACDIVIVTPPVLAATGVTGRNYSLVWQPLAGAVDVLEEAVDPGFASAIVVYRGSSGKVSFYGRAEGSYFYRVRRELGGSTSDYSNGVAVEIEPAMHWQEIAETAYRNDVLLDVHRALLRMSAAKGDMFAVLGMPAHYREQDALSHAGQLRSSTSPAFAVPALDPSEPSALSYGALYHPWMTGHEENDLTELRTNSPDGACVGLMAKRCSTRGAWISPGNEPLSGVVTLTPGVGRAYWQAFQDAGLNLVRQEPGGFLCLSSQTLSNDPDLTQINVRRLLSLLRKVAIERGALYVFEPNSNDFRRSVQRGFESALDGMFQKGAFKGRTSREGFQVVTDSSVNTAAAIDRGQFFVELRVAPSVPLRFLTVRLMQTADRTSVTEGK